MKKAAMADVKAHFSDYIRAAEDGPIVVTRNGKPAAILLAFSDEDELERLMMAHSPRLQSILDAARKRIAAGAGIRDDEFWRDIKGTKKPNGRAGKRAKSASS
jgi:prevent-host-death family protein